MTLTEVEQYLRGIQVTRELSDCQMEALNIAIELLKDRHEIVRCEDCKHSMACFTDDGELLYDCNKITWSGNTLNKPDWFCADGERKSD